MLDKLISVITVNYNSDILLTETVNSIISQTYNNFELIIIDGLSTDNSLVEIKKIKDDRIRIYCEKDNGIYDAMNKGLKLAKGDIITFLNSGDYFLDKNLLNNVNKSAFWEKSLIGICDLANTKNEIFRPFKIGNYCHQTIFYYKLTREFDYKKYLICADFEMTSYLLSINRNVTRINGRVLYDYNGISSIQVKRRITEKRQIILNYLSLFGWRGILTIIFISFKIWLKK